MVNIVENMSIMNKDGNGYKIFVGGSGFGSEFVPASTGAGTTLNPTYIF